jgi:subtilase family serine protease
LQALLAGVLAAGLFPAGAQEIAASPATVLQAPAPPQQMLHRMLLVLKSSEAQSSELDKLLAAQQTPGDSHFHHWLTPAAFADRFSPSAAQTDQVAAWLRAQGMTVAPIPAGRGWIEFSGTVAQVQRAFGTTVVSTVPAQDGKIRYQLIGKVRLPESVASVAVGLASLDGVLSEPASTNPVSLSSSLKSLAAQTSLANAEALTPGLADGVLQLSAVRAEGTTGTGETIRRLPPSVWAARVGARCTVQRTQSRPCRG